MPNFKHLLKTRTSWSLKMTGVFVESVGAGQAIELLCEDPVKDHVLVCGEADPKHYPISKKRHNPEFLR